jgi:transcriptional regulator with XRE-family HTH domain
MSAMPNPAATLAALRRQAGLTQAELAARTGTSQATISAYENGSKEPSLRTFSRLLSAMGARLEVQAPRGRLHEPSRAELDRSGRRLAQVIALAEALPARHERSLRFPRLTAARAA